TRRPRRRAAHRDRPGHGRHRLRPRARPAAARRQDPPPPRVELLMRLERRVETLLAAGGAIAARWPRYEDRPGQKALAREIAATLESGGILLAEAATGLGKSLAYLLPAALLAAEGERRVVVATCTRSLQDQLV